MTHSMTKRLMTLAEAARRCPKSVHVSTIWRWALRGIGPHRLTTIKVGGRRYTTLEDLDVFFQATDTSLEGPSTKSVLATGRKRSVTAAREELMAEGCLPIPSMGEPDLVDRPDTPINDQPACKRGKEPATWPSKRANTSGAKA